MPPAGPRLSLSSQTRSDKRGVLWQSPREAERQEWGDHVTWDQIQVPLSSKGLAHPALLQPLLLHWGGGAVTGAGCGPLSCYSLEVHVLDVVSDERIWTWSEVTVFNIAEPFPPRAVCEFVSV